jgi:hypothetical protein
LSFWPPCFDRNDGRIDPALTQNPLHFPPEILKEHLDTRKGVRPTRIVLGSVPVIADRRPPPKPATESRH